jgi:hypothetical protein
LDETINLQGAEPALSDSTYNQLVAEIRDIVGDKFYAPCV